MPLSLKFENLGINLQKEYSKLDFSKLDKNKTLADFLEKYKRFPVIAVSGPAGTGKTTITNIVSDFYGAKSYRELPELNPFLNLIGKTKDKIKDSLWYPNQSLFLNQDTAIITDGFLNSQENTIIFDFAITQTKAYGELKLKGKEKTDFINNFNNLFFGNKLGYGGLPKPDLIIEVRSSDETIIQRRLNRGKRVDGMFKDEVGEMNEIYKSGLIENHYENVIIFDNNEECTINELIPKVHSFLKSKIDKN